MCIVRKTNPSFRRNSLVVLWLSLGNRAAATTLVCGYHVENESNRSPPPFAGVYALGCALPYHELRRNTWSMTGDIRTSSIQNYLIRLSAPKWRTSRGHHTLILKRAVQIFFTRGLCLVPCAPYHPLRCCKDFQQVSNDAGTGWLGCGTPKTDYLLPSCIQSNVTRQLPRSNSPSVLDSNR